MPTSSPTSASSTPASLTQIAVLGLGAMGSRMAQRLLDAGHAVTVWNRTASAADPLVAAGATAAATPREAAEGASVVIVMVHGDEASRAVWLGSDGEAGVLGTLRADALAVDASTLTPGWTETLAREAAARGLRFVAAPVVGSRPQAEAGALVTLAGGDGEAVEAARPILGAYSKAVKHTGAAGTAAAMKLVINGLFATQAAVFAEALAFAERSGFARAEAAAFLAGLPITSPAAARLVGLMAAGDYAPNFPVHLVAKDLGYAVAAAHDLGLDTPTLAGARAAFDAAEAAGFGQSDIAGIAQAYAAD